jgi:hypothetical protein
MPIQTDVLNTMPIAAMLDIVFSDDPHDHHSANNVKTVQSCSYVIKTPEVAREEREAVLDLGRVFVGFETHEKAAEHNRQPNPHTRFLRIALLGSSMSEYNEETGSQKPEGIAGANEGVRIRRLDRP